MHAKHKDVEAGHGRKAGFFRKKGPHLDSFLHCSVYYIV